MRYDNVLRKLAKAEARFESEVRHILAAAAKTDVDAGTKMLASLKPKKKKHWTQMPKNKKRVRAIQHKMQAAKKKAE